MRTSLVALLTLSATLGVSCAQELEYYDELDPAPIAPQTPDASRADASVPVIEEGPHRPGVVDAGTMPPGPRDASLPDARPPRDATLDADAAHDAADAAADATIRADASVDADAGLAPWEMPTGEQRNPVSVATACPMTVPTPPVSTTCRAWPWHVPACYRAPTECAALHESQYCVSVRGGTPTFLGVDTGATCALAFSSNYPLSASAASLAMLRGDLFSVDGGAVVKYSLADGSFDMAPQAAGALFLMGEQLVILAPDGRLLSYPSWTDLKRNQNARSLASVAPATGAAFGANAKTLVAAWPTGRIDVVTPGVSARVLRLVGFDGAGEGGIRGADLSEDGSRIYLLTTTGLWIIDADTGVTLRRIAAPALDGLDCSTGFAPSVSVPPQPGDARPGFYYEPDRSEAAILSSSDCTGPFNGPRYYGQNAGPELLVIGTYFHEQSTVIDERASPHTLVLTAVQGADWTVTVKPGALLERILVNGSSAVSLRVDSASPVPVEYHVDDPSGNRTSMGTAAGSWPALDEAILIDNLERYTGRPVTELFGCHLGSTYTVRNVLPLCAP